MTDYFFKDHELLVIQGEARLHGLERINSSKTMSPRLWEAKPACTGQNRAPCSRSVRDATSGARASGAPHRQRRSSPAGASNRSGRASACTLSRFRHSGRRLAPDTRRDAQSVIIGILLQISRGSEGILPSSTRWGPDALAPRRVC